MRRVFLAVLALVPVPGSADDIFTRGGGSVSGEIVERRADSIVVDVGGGTLELPVGYIERIVPGPSPATIFRDNAKRLAVDDLTGWLALARWAHAEGLRTQADEAFAHVLVLDPDQPAAHQALGHVKVGALWMSRDEAYRAQGLVPFEGQWMTPDERHAIQAERAEAARAVQAEAEALARLRESEAQARATEAQARIAEAQARIAEADATRVEAAGTGLQWSPVGAGLHWVTTGFPGFWSSCQRRLLFGPGITIGVPVAGRGPMIGRGPSVAPRGPSVAAASPRVMPASRPFAGR